MDKRGLTLALLLIAFLTAALAADLNGKWQGQMKGSDGQDLEVNMNLKLDGEKLTGTVATSYGEEQIEEGTVKGSDISFVINAGGGTFKLIYTGKVEGEELKFKVDLNGSGTGDLTARRVK